MVEKLISSPPTAGGGRNVPRQPRKMEQPQIPSNSARPTQRSRPPEPVSSEEENAIHDAEKFESSDEYYEDGELESPELAHSDSKPDPNFETPDSDGDHTNQEFDDDVTSTKVEERKVTTIQRGGKSVVITEGTGQPRRTTVISQTSSGQQQYAVHSGVQGGVQRNESFYRETHALPAVTEVRHSTFATSSNPMADEPWEAPKSTFSSTKEKLLEMQRIYEEENRLRREENKCAINLLSGEHEDYERLCREQFAAFREEEGRLLMRISQLEIELSSLHSGNTNICESGTLDAVITTITTSITTITTTIRTITTRVDKWKGDGRGKGQIIISNADLQQLASDLSATSSRLIKIQESYDELLKNFGAIRRDRQAMLSLRDEQGRNIASLTAEVAQLKNADAERVQQLTALRQENECLRRDLKLASSQISDLQGRLDTQSSELVSLHDKVRTQASSIDEKDITITSLTGEVARWKQSDANKADQLAMARQEYDKSQRELSASFSRFEDLQKRYDAQSKELSSVRSELQMTKISAVERDRKIITLTAEVDNLEKASVAMKERFDAEHRAKEKLVEDLTAFSAQTTDLKKRFEALSRENISIQKQLQETISLLEVKEHTITSLRTEIAHLESEITMKTEQTTSAGAEIGRLRGELSSSSSRVAELQKRIEGQSKEIDSLRGELRQIEALYPGNGRPSGNAVSKQIADALAEKDQQMRDLRRDLDSATSRNAELQKLYESLTTEVSDVRNELKVTTSQNERTITSLNAQVEQWKRTHDAKADQLATALKQVEKLQRDLSDSTSRLAEFQSRYEAQSRDIVELRNKVQASATSTEAKDRTIASLTAEVDQWKHSDAANIAKLTVALQRVDELTASQSASVTQIAQLRAQLDAQSLELTTVREKLRIETSLLEDKEHIITSLNTDVERLRNGDAASAQKIATMVEQIKKLEKGLSDSASQLAKLKGDYEVQSENLASVRIELQTKVSSDEEKGRKIAALTAKVREWERTDAAKDDRIVAAGKRADDLQRDLTNSAAKLAELQKRYDERQKELDALHTQIAGEESESSNIITSLRSQIESLESSISVKTNEVTTLQKNLDQIRRDLANVSDSDAAKDKELVAARENIEQLRRDLDNASSQIKNWKGSDTSKKEELISARKEVEQLHRDLESASSRISASERQLAESTTQIERLKSSEAVKAEELATARKDLGQLRRDLAASSSKTVELERKSTELNSQIERLNSSDIVKTEELVAARKDLVKLGQDLSSSSSLIIEWQQRYKVQSVELTKKTDELADARKDLEQLKDDLSESSSRLYELQRLYDAQLAELKLLRVQLDTMVSAGGDNDQIVASLRAQIETMKDANAEKAKELSILSSQNVELKTQLDALSESSKELEQMKVLCATTEGELATAREDLDKLGRDLSNLSFQVIEWQRRCKEQSDELVTREDELAEAQEKVEQLQDELSASSSRVSELQELYDGQSTELKSLQAQLQSIASTGGEKDRRVVALNAQIGTLKSRDAEKAKELSVLSSRNTELKAQLDALSESSKELERLKVSCSTMTKELATAREDLIKLGRDLSSSSSQIVEWKQRYNAQSAELTVKEDELAEAHKKFKRLQDELSTSSSRFSELQELYDAQSAELESLHAQLTAIMSAGGNKDQIVVALNAQIETLKNTNAEKAKEVSALSSQNAELKAKLDALSESSSSTSIVVSEETRKVHGMMITEVKDYATVIKLTATVDEWFREDNDRAAKLARELEARNKEKEELRRKLDMLKEIYIRSPELKQIFQSDTVEIRRQNEAATAAQVERIRLEYETKLAAVHVQVKERQSQLDDVKRFVTTADTYADSAISQELQKLNAEVQQSTTFMAECIAENFRVRTTKATTEQSSAARRVSEAVGQILADCLGSKDGDEVALYLPIAFQAYLTYYLHELISSWTIERGYNDLINKIYERLQKSEAQTVSGRWRSLTRTYIPPNSTSDSKKLISDAMTGLCNIVVAASCATSLSEAKTKLSKFENKLASILMIASKFGKMIGEVVSADFEVLAIRPVEVFEENTMEEDMDDDDQGGGDPGAANGQKVLCSTQLGMTKKMQLESGAKDTLTVTKAKVVLESFLDG